MILKKRKRWRKEKEKNKVKLRNCICFVEGLNFLKRLDSIIIFCNDGYL